MRRVASIMATSITAVAVLAGCPSREVSKVDIDQEKVDKREIPTNINRQVDILFVIDDSESMKEEQDSLAANFDRFIGVLQQIEGGLPDVHIAVVNTDMGANDVIPRCGDPDNGAFQYTPSADCALGDSFALDGTYLVDVADETQPDGRRRNYSGSLQDAFSCIAKVGLQGCGFEMQLESMRQGLLNAPADFLREEAFLAVIFITDEDDCSTRDYAMFDVNETRIDGPLGPLDSFRCFEFGVECAGDNPRELGAKDECVPRTDSQYMFGVQEYVDFLTELKGGRYPIIVGGIIGDAEPIEVDTKIIEQTGEEKLTLIPSCESASGQAFPGVRLQAFLEAFQRRNTVTTICNENLSDALTVVAQLLAKVIGNPCLEPGVDLNPDAEGVQHDCQVSDVVFDLNDAPTDDETPLAQCSSATPDASEYPCWYLTDTGDKCSVESGQPIELVVERGDQTPPAGTRTVLHCVTK